jgi:hypothetical protein
LMLVGSTWGAVHGDEMRGHGRTALSLPSRNGAELQHAIDTAIAAGRREVTVPVADFTFLPGVSLVVSGAVDLAIVGGAGITASGHGSVGGIGDNNVSVAPTNTTQLWFYCGAGVHIANSTNVRFAAFVIDYAEPCFSQGVVTVAPRAVAGDKTAEEVGDATAPQARMYHGLMHSSARHSQFLMCVRDAPFLYASHALARAHTHIHTHIHTHTRAHTHTHTHAHTHTCTRTHTHTHTHTWWRAHIFWTGRDPL